MISDVLNNLTEEERLHVFNRHMQTLKEEDQKNILLFFLSPKSFQLLSTNALKKMALTTTNMPLWLFEECRQKTKDITETVSLILPKSIKSERINLTQLLKEILLVSKENKLLFIEQKWAAFNAQERYVFNKIITGQAFKELNRHFLEKLLSVFLKITQERAAIILYQAKEVSFERQWDDKDDCLLPVKFRSLEQARALDIKLEEDYFVSYHRPFIPVQIIKENNKLFVWAAGNYLLNEQLEHFDFLNKSVPQLFFAKAELKLKHKGVFLNEQSIQRKIAQGLKLKQWTISIYNIEKGVLEVNNAQQEACVLEQMISLSLENGIDKMLQDSRREGANGVLFRNENNVFQLESKAIQFTAVLVYVQRVMGSKTKYEQFTFAVRNENGNLISVVKTDDRFFKDEMQEWASWINKNKVDRNGPVISVSATRIFSIRSAIILQSARTKTGLKLEKNMILEELENANMNDISSLSSLQAHLPNS